MPLSLSVEQDRTRQRLLAGSLILASLRVFYQACRIFPIISLCIDIPWMLYTQWALHRAHKTVDACLLMIVFLVRGPIIAAL